jgi:uncharacterized protein (TIGR02145 family)
MRNLFLSVCILIMFSPSILGQCEGPSCCDVGTVWDFETSTCVVSFSGDFDYDGFVGTYDLLEFLAVFGTYKDIDNGCTDPSACNYDPFETEDDGLCMWFDNCGVCGGDNSTCFAECGDDIEHHGYYYSTGQIGNQCWFLENCRYLPYVMMDSHSHSTLPLTYVYGYNGTGGVNDALTTSNYNTYGVLYNYPAVMTGDVCPSGWHIPTDEEFTELVDFAGGMSDAGEQLKSTAGWINNNGTNASGFNAMPGGLVSLGGFANMSLYGWWWTASPKDGISSWTKQMSFGGQECISYDMPNEYGVSARCLKDSPPVLGCTDPSACNYDPFETESDGLCMWFDNCGVCGGDNSTCFTDCGDELEHQGYNYSTIEINGQCWFAENCRYLPYVAPSSLSSEVDPLWYVYGHQNYTISLAEMTYNYEEHGVLYNYEAAMFPGTCPSGWHVPSDIDWTQLTNSLGGMATAALQMKNQVGWELVNGNGSNTSGFTGKPSGYCLSAFDLFADIDAATYYWSSTLATSNEGYARHLHSSDFAHSHILNTSSGFSVRCLKD